jgi:2-C-methyl-D-erythritol 4-phosphate cytidylyltransferase
MGFDKLWAPLGDRPVVAYALDTLAASPRIVRLAVVVAEDRIGAMQALVETQASGAVVCRGGARRRDSVASGLSALRDCAWVLVHDAARPFLTERLIDDGIEAVQAADAAVAAVPVRDTIKRVAGGVVQATLPREALWSVQTPQLFRTEVLARALAACDEDVTDEAALVERLGGRVVVYPGSDSNWKLTAPGDLELAAAWLAVRRAAAVCPAVASV